MRPSPAATHSAASSTIYGVSWAAARQDIDCSLLSGASATDCVCRRVRWENKDNGPAFAVVNPARSTGVAIFAGWPYIAQLWLFWFAPLIGGVVGGGVARALQYPDCPFDRLYDVVRRHRHSSGCFAR